MIVAATGKGHYGVVSSQLLEKGGPVNQAMNTGASPVFVAAQNGHKDIVALLLEKGAAVNRVTTLTLTLTLAPTLNPKP